MNFFSFTLSIISTNKKIDNKLHKENDYPKFLT